MRSLKKKASLRPLACATVSGGLHACCLLFVSAKGSGGTLRSSHFHGVPRVFCVLFGELSVVGNTLELRARIESDQTRKAHKHVAKVPLLAGSANTILTVRVGSGQ